MPESILPDTIQNTNYTVTLEQENDDLVLPIPEELLIQLDWKENDVLEWIIEDDHIILRKFDGTIWICF